MALRILLADADVIGGRGGNGGDAPADRGDPRRDRGGHLSHGRAERGEGRGIECGQGKQDRADKRARHGDHISQE